MPRGRMFPSRTVPPGHMLYTRTVHANLSTRIALKVSSRTDSQVIIDRPGAESLCGRGDMLYCGPDGDIPLRLHGCMLTKDELEELHRRAVSVEYIDGFRGTDEVSVAAG